MAVTEVSGLMKYKDASGNVYLMLPITTKDNVDGIDEIEAQLSETIRYTEQTLTDAQKTRARTNIGAVDTDYVDNAMSSIDVSGDIKAHNTNTAAHADIRELIESHTHESGDISGLGSLAAKSTVAKSDLASDVRSSLNKADTALQSFTETDPTVPSWAKAASKPTYTASEVGADVSGAAASALTEAKSYADSKIANLINGAPTTLDTLGEIATAMSDNADVVEALESAIGNKADTGHKHNSSDISGLGSLATKSAVAKSDLASDVQSSLGKADTALQSFTETDPTVPAWAKAASKPSYTASEVGAAPASTHRIATYTSLSQIGLTSGSETLEAIASAMPDNSILQYAVTGGSSSVYPDSSGRMEVRRADADTVVFYFNTRSGWSIDEYAETYVCHARVYDGGASVTGWVKVFDGGSMPVNIFYGEGTGDQASAYKDVTITQEGFALKKGVTIAVKFNNQNKATSPKLNVNETGDISVKQNGSVDVDTMMWAANQVVLFTYDGTNWLMHGAVRATVNGRYGPTSLSSATDSTAESLAATPKAVKAAYDLANSKAPAYTYSTTDLTAGTSALTTGKMYLVYE